MAFKVFHAVLKFAVRGFVQVLDDRGSSPLGASKMRFDILDKNGQALGSKAEFRGTAIAVASCLSMTQASPRCICAPESGSP